MTEDKPRKQSVSPGGDELFRLMVESVKDYAIFATDSEGRIVSWNRGAERTFGYAEDEAVGQSAEIIFTPEDREQGVPEGELRKAAEEGRAEDERWHVRRDGTRFWASGIVTPLRDEGGALRGFVKVARDQTERKAAAEALRESERRLRVIFNQQFQFMAILSPEGVLVDVNELPLLTTGLAREQVVGRLFWDTPWWSGLPEMRAGWPARLAAAARSEGPVFSEDLYQTADGATRVANASVTAVKDPAGGVEFFIVEASDVTERKRVEEERELLLAGERAARAEAERANRMKDEFLATLSHELRTPLTAILGWSRMLTTTRLDAESTARALESIERNARAQVRLIDDILDVSRIITGKLRLDVRPVDLAPVVEEAVESVRPAAEAKGVRLQRVLDTGPQVVSGDPERLQQVVWNLLSNAVKFTPKGGRVQVRLERIDSHVEVIVSDTGKGIGPDVLPHVFERFLQADSSSTRAHGGLGLGLAIVRHLVELHGGTVRAESEGEGTGATFTVDLPLMIVRAGRAKARRNVEQTYPTADTGEELVCPPELEGLHVLFVDDEEDARALLTTVLESCGARVTAVGSAREALEELGRGKFDVLLSDIGMPGEDGYWLIKKVRKLPVEGGGRTPAAALTAYARAKDRMRALRAGYQMHVPKPVEPAELVAVVASLAGRHEGDWAREEETS